jgi:hypothetical protein
MNSRWNVEIDEEGGYGHLSQALISHLDTLAEHDPMLALDVMGDWIVVLVEKYEASFHRLYPSLAPPTKPNQEKD